MSLAFYSHFEWKRTIHIASRLDREGYSSDLKKYIIELLFQYIQLWISDEEISRAISITTEIAQLKKSAFDNEIRHRISAHIKSICDNPEKDDTDWGELYVAHCQLYNIQWDVDNKKKYKFFEQIYTKQHKLPPSNYNQQTIMINYLFDTDTTHQPLQKGKIYEMLSPMLINKGITLKCKICKIKRLLVFTESIWNRMIKSDILCDERHTMTITLTDDISVALKVAEIMCTTKDWIIYKQYSTIFKRMLKHIY